MMDNRFYLKVWQLTLTWVIVAFPPARDCFNLMLQNLVQVLVSLKISTKYVCIAFALKLKKKLICRRNFFLWRYHIVLMLSKYDIDHIPFLGFGWTFFSTWNRSLFSCWMSFHSGSKDKVLKIQHSFLLIGSERMLHRHLNCELVLSKLK